MTTEIPWGNLSCAVFHIWFAIVFFLFAVASGFRQEACHSAYIANLRNVHAYLAFHFRNVLRTLPDVALCDSGLFGPTTTTTTTTTRKLYFTPDSNENYNWRCYTKASMKRPLSIHEITYLEFCVIFPFIDCFQLVFFAFSWRTDRHYCFRWMHAIYHPFMHHLTCWKTRRTE